MTSQVSPLPRWHRSSELSRGIIPNGVDVVENVFRTNLWTDDPFLQFLTRRCAPVSARDEKRLVEAGRVIGGVIARNADIIDQNGPTLVRYDRMGKIVNLIKHCPEGLESRRCLWSLSPSAFNGSLPDMPCTTLSAMRLMLAEVDTGLCCAMGVTNPMRYLVDKWMDGEVKAMLLKGLEDPCYDSSFFSSIWLTEQSGGSDLGALETVAQLDANGRWRLTGLKWFCSITDAKLIMTLARPVGMPRDVKSLALFIVPREGQDVDAVHIRRLKSKLGLRSVPSGEVELREAFAWPCGDPLDGRGINRVMEVVSPLQRNGVAGMGAGITRRCFVFAREYGLFREAWGKKLMDHHSFRVHLLEMLVESESCFSLVMKTASCTDAFGQPCLDPLVRILAPLSKLYCCRKGVDMASKGVETFGGNGFIADWPMERLYRDAQNHPIWEGTEQVMAMDVQRAISNKAVLSALRSFFSSVCEEPLEDPLLFPLVAVLKSVVEALFKRIASSVASGAFLLFANYLATVVCLATAVDDARKEVYLDKSLRKAVTAAYYFAFHFQNPLDVIRVGNPLVENDSGHFEAVVCQRSLLLSDPGTRKFVEDAISSLTTPSAKL
jgi:acyl-CoA dehydrogenase